VRRVRTARVFKEKEKEKKKKKKKKTSGHLKSLFW